MRQLSLLLASLTLLSLAPVSNGAIAAGGFAIIGYDDIFDSFTLVALDEIAAGQTVYFTDSGWVSGLNVFRGGSPTATNQLEGESMLKMNVTSTISAGTVISSLAGGAAWNWVNFGPIDGSNALGAGSACEMKYDECTATPVEQLCEAWLRRLDEAEFKLKYAGDDNRGERQTAFDAIDAKVKASSCSPTAPAPAQNP